MAMKRMRRLNEEIAILEKYGALVDDDGIDGDSLQRLKAQRSIIQELASQRGEIGVFPENTPLNNKEVLERRKRSSVQIGDLVQLPIVASNKIAYPNVIARSPLFGLASGGKERLFRHSIAQDGKIEILVTGELLSQADLDVWLLCLKLSQDNLAKPVQISEYAFRARLGKTHGSKTYLLLRESLTRLALLLMTVRRGRAEFSVNERILTYELEQGETGMMLRFSVGPTWAKLLGVGDWSAQLLTVRQRLAGKPLAQLLVTIGYTHKPGFPVTLESLHKAARSESKLWEFKRLASKALGTAIEAGAFKPDSGFDSRKGCFYLRR